MEQADRDNALKSVLEIPTETQTIEFKRVAGEAVASKTAQTIVAMANTDGGIVILGIDDPATTRLKGFDRIYGIDENAEVFDSIGREIQRIVPPLVGIWPPTTLESPQPRKRVGLVFVPKAAENFHSINNHVYVRAERGNRLLTAHEVVNFAYAKGFEKADRQLVAVDFSLLATRYFDEWKMTRRLNGGSPEAVLEKVGLARKNGTGPLQPTLAAILLFAESPNDLTETKCAIRVFQYSGTIEQIKETPNLIGLPKTIGGPLIRQIGDAHEYVLTLLRAGIRIPSGFKAVYQIPERAVKEAITNAVIHRDYHMKRDIEIKIYEDRLEVESPGLLPYNITRTNIGWERAEGYRNDLLVKHLREFPSPPNLDQNEGVRAMRQDMAAKTLYPPIFLTYPFLKDTVRVVLLNEHRATEWEKMSSYLKAHKYITNETARETTGVVQRDKMSYLLKKWVRQGLLVKLTPPSGFVRGTKYKLPDAPDVKNP